MGQLVDVLSEKLSKKTRGGRDLLYALGESRKVHKRLGQEIKCLAV